MTTKGYCETWGDALTERERERRTSDVDERIINRAVAWMRVFFQKKREREKEGRKGDEKRIE